MDIKYSHVLSFNIVMQERRKGCKSPANMIFTGFYYNMPVGYYKKNIKNQVQLESLK